MWVSHGLGEPWQPEITLQLFRILVFSCTVSTERKYTLTAKPSIQNRGGTRGKVGVRHTHHWVGPNWTKPRFGGFGASPTFHLPPSVLSTQLDHIVYTFFWGRLQTKDIGTEGLTSNFWVQKWYCHRIDVFVWRKKLRHLQLATGLPSFLLLSRSVASRASYNSPPYTACKKLDYPELVIKIFGMATLDLIFHTFNVFSGYGRAGGGARHGHIWRSSISWTEIVASSLYTTFLGFRVTSRSQGKLILSC